MSKKVAIQGYEASYHHLAAQAFFGKGLEIVPCDSFAETFLELKDGNADYALLAIENSLYGSINKVYDLLLKHRLWIVGEVYLRIEHCLVVLPGATIQTIKEVHSQAEALAQCEVFLDTTLALAERHEHHDTAASVAAIKRWNDPTKAAIASASASRLHGMKIMARGIESNKQNYTRFVVLQKKKVILNDANKTSLVLVTNHQPGALYRALGAFAENNINLTKLQSRPIVGEAWHYMFYVDVGAGLQDKHFQSALKELKRQKCEVRLLGSYKSGR